ncbi:MAG: phosphate ABC transporter substrate-binding protein [Pseudomonadales bacterium]|nr:phosphate ABC transporter substrate-binding protein [Pseudomonadales bacterium]
MKKIIIFNCIALLTLMFSGVSYAIIVVVVNPENTQDFSKSEIRRIFLGRQKAFANGNKVDKFDLPEGNDIRTRFAEKVLGKSEGRLNSYWARMLFSSKAKPPKVLSDAEAIKIEVSQNLNAIAYMDKNDVDGSVKVIFMEE